MSNASIRHDGNQKNYLFDHLKKKRSIEHILDVGVWKNELTHWNDFAPNKCNVDLRSTSSVSRTGESSEACCCSSSNFASLGAASMLCLLDLEFAPQVSFLLLLYNTVALFAWDTALDWTWDGAKVSQTCNYTHVQKKQKLLAHCKTGFIFFFFFFSKGRRLKCACVCNLVKLWSQWCRWIRLEFIWPGKECMGHLWGIIRQTFNGHVAPNTLIRLNLYFLRSKSEWFAKVEVIRSSPLL